jgi:hypothetical protein
MIDVIFLLLSVISLVALSTALATIVKRGMGPYVASRRMPVMTARATLASKREEMAESFMHNLDRRFGEVIDPSDTVRSEPVEWYAAFNLVDGEQREFCVSQAVYESLIVGDEGDLAWRGHLFVRFSPHGIEVNPNKPDKAVPDNWL